MFVCIVMYICLVFYYIFSGLLGSGWFGCLFVLMYCKSVVCFKILIKCFLVLLYILPLPSLLGSGWLAWLSSFNWSTWLVYSYSIVHLL